MNRRGLLVSLLAPFAARLLPREEPVHVVVQFDSSKLQEAIFHVSREIDKTIDILKRIPVVTERVMTIEHRRVTG